MDSSVLARARSSAGLGTAATALAGLFAASGAFVAFNLPASAAPPPVPSATSCTGNSGEPQIFYVNGKLPVGGATPQCATILPASGVILPGDTIGAIYSDEATINHKDKAKFPKFEIDGVAQPITLTNIIPPHVQHHETSVTITVPTNLAPGVHTATVQAWDSDQTKVGGDFGQVVFTFGVSDASIKITPNSATNQLRQQHVFTVTATANPFTANLPVVFGAITTSVVPTPNLASSTTCATPAVSGDVASCTITINSSVPGSFTADASVSLTINGEVLHRSTDGTNGPAGNGGSGPATKTYIDAPPTPTPTPTAVPTPSPTATPTGGVEAVKTTVPNTGAFGEASVVQSLALLIAGGTLIGLVVRRRRGDG
jgi:hypothetical protein